MKGICKECMQTEMHTCTVRKRSKRMVGVAVVVVEEEGTSLWARDLADFFQAECRLV